MLSIFFSLFAYQAKETCLCCYLAYAIQANKVFTTVFKLDTVFLQRLVEPVLFVLTLVSQCLTCHESKQTLILAKTLTSDPYKPELL